MCSFAIVGSPVGCWGINYACMQVFLTKLLLLQKNATNRDHQGMLKVILYALMVAKL